MSWFSSEKKKKNDEGERFSFFLFWRKLKNKCLGSHQKKRKKNDKSERKYHIIRKMHAFHLFAKTKYLTRSVAHFL